MQRYEETLYLDINGSGNKPRNENIISKLYINQIYILGLSNYTIVTDLY